MSSKRRRQMRRHKWPTPHDRQPWVHNEAVRAAKLARRDPFAALGDVADAMRQVGEYWTDVVIPAFAEAAASIAGFGAAFVEQYEKAAAAQALADQEARVAEEQEAPAWA
jgi:hypothetical protein